MDKAGSPLKITPSKKRKRPSSDLSLCIICQTPKNIELICATAEGKESLWNAACIRKDVVYQRIVSEFNTTFLEAKREIFYHKNCIAPYRSQTNLSHKLGEQVAEKVGKTENKNGVENEIDWKICIICQKQKNKSLRKTHKLVKHSKCQKLLDAARRAGDQNMFQRFTADDLVNKKPVYHAACMQSIIHRSENKENKKTACVDTNHDKAFQLLVEEITEDLINRHRIFSAAELLTLYKSYLPIEQRDSYTTWKLKPKLEAWFGKNIQVHYLKGEEAIIFSSEVTIADAIRLATKLKEDAVHQNVKFDTKPMFDNDQVILNKAVRILKDSMSDIMASDQYPGPKGMSNSSSVRFIPAILLEFVKELINCSDEKQDSTSTRAIAISECIIYGSKGVLPPLHLGIGITLHQDYGSRKLIDLLNAFGFSASYPEVRQFVTSLAANELDKIKDGVYYPAGIRKLSEGGNLIQEGVDNIDINTNTIDGKDTFHSLARVCFQQTGDSVYASEDLSIPKRKEYALKLSPEVEKTMKPMPFSKPKVRPVPPRYNIATERIKSIMKDSFNVKDFIWVVLRSFAREPLQLNVDITTDVTKIIPFWSDFNKSTSPVHGFNTLASYSPIIDSNPTEMDTIYTSMVNCKATAKVLGQDYSVQTMDQQLYAIAQQVKWACPESFLSHHNRLGGFHTICCFVGCIGKLWGDGGLTDLLKDSNVYASCTVDSMLDGRQYHRSVRALTLVYEALMSTLLQIFLEISDGREVLTSEGQETINTMYSSLTESGGLPKGASDVFQSINILQPNLISEDFLAFLAYGCSKYPTFNYWCMLLEAIQIMLENIRAERSGDWKGHLASQANMLPYFFCTNKQNYSRWLPVYLLEMLVDLPEELEAKFEAGEFTFRICPNASFNGIWTDMAVEKTVIRDSKSDSGIVGVTRRKGALLRWYLSRHIMGNYSEVVKHRAGLIHPEEDPVIKVSDSSLQKDEDDVKTLMNHIHSSMSNPFALDTDNEGVLINISTGLQATDEVKESLLEAVETGKAKLESFVRSNLELGSNGNFYSPISRLKLKTFQSMTIPTKLSTRSEGIKRANVSPETIFRRGLALAEFREDVTVEALTSHPIGSVPLSLFNEDGSLRKTNKSDLALYLESLADISDMDETTPSNVIYIRDGIAVLHSLSAETCTTFDDLVFKYVRGVISDMSIADIVIDVFDRYDVQHSIKETERKRRSRTLKSKTYSVNGSRPIPTWKDFMSVSANKTALLQFMSEAVPNVAKTYFRDEKMLYLSGCMKDPTQVMSVTNNEISCWPELQNTHEEADSRIIYHMMEIDKIPSSYKDPKRIIIKATDTDVLVLATYFFPQISNISEVWVAAGHVTKTVDKRRLIPVHRIVANSNPTLLNILPAVHALTGCDSVSSLYGIGKKSVMKILQDSGSVTYQNLSEIATDSNEETMVNIARPFVARLYDPKQYHTSKHSSLNKLRTALSTTKDISLAKLPPCEDAFKFHVKRAAYQCKIWMNANKRNPVDESPLEHGWEEDNSGLAPIYFEGQMAVDILSKMYCSCSSKKPCSSKACICKATNLACIGICGCSSTDKCAISNIVNRNNKYLA